MGAEGREGVVSAKHACLQRVRARQLTDEGRDTEQLRASPILDRRIQGNIHQAYRGHAPAASG